MKLRHRILLLFLGFAVLPLAMLAVRDGIQWRRALEDVIVTRGEVVVERIARGLEGAHHEVAAELRRAADTLVREGAVDSSAARLALADLAGTVDEVLLLENGERRWVLGHGRSAAPCGATGEPIAVRTAVPLRPELQLEARILPGALLESAGLGEELEAPGIVQLVRPSSTRAVYDSRCPGEPTEVPTAALAVVRVLASGAPGRAGTFRHELGGRSWQGSVAYVPALDLGVVALTDRSAYLLPFRSARLGHLAVALLILAVGGYAYFSLSRKDRALGALTAAADEVRVGNLNPWLPPPGQDDVGRLSLAFRNMTDRLAESIRQVELTEKLAAVGELASYLSHEIRNPLSSIRLSLQSLHRDLDGGFIPDDTDRVIKIALGEVQRLDGVVRTVLEVGRSNGQGSAAACAVHEPLAETLEMMTPKIRARGVELDYEPRAERDRVRGEVESLRGVWINLIVNALDALEGRSDGRIRVSTWSDTKYLMIRITDNGPGVPPDIVDDIFKPFFTTKLSGNGIGLPTALRTVQAWGGTITYEPAVGGTGAVFVVRLSLLEPAAPEAETREPAAEPAAVD